MKNQRDTIIKDYYTRFPEHLILTIKYQLQSINYFSKKKDYSHLYTRDYVYARNEEITIPLNCSPMKQAVEILQQLLDYHPEDSQLLIFMLCCQDQDICAGSLIQNLEEKTNPKKSLRDITFKSWSNRLAILTNSKLKFTFYLKRNRNTD